MHRAVGQKVAGTVFGRVGEEEESAGSVPDGVEGFVVFKDRGGVGPKGAEPRAVDAAVDEVDGLASVEEEG